MMEKLASLAVSRRFWAAVAGVATVFLTDALGLTQEQAAVIVAMLGAWIVGDSLNKTL